MSSTPNIVIIMTDQQRGDFLRSNGFGLDTMPFVDEMAGRGAAFSRCYTPTPLCLPTRCSLFTGRFPSALRVRENGGGANIFYTEDMRDVLRRAGYSIDLCGKNHSHLKLEDFDFVRPYGHSGGGKTLEKSEQERKMDDWLRGLPAKFHPEPTPFPVECQLPHRIVRDGVECLESRDDRPFFLWLSFPEPHNPYQVPEPYFSLFPPDAIPDRFAGPEVVDSKGFQWRWYRDLYESKVPGYDEQWRLCRAVYCGMIRLIDDQIGRFVGYLESEELLDDTILIFTSDHGDFAGDYGLRRKGIGVPECLVRVPFVITGPGIAAHSAQRREFISLVDVFPTLCEALGLETPDGVQGRSLWPLLTGADFPADEFRSIYGEVGIGGVYYRPEDDLPLHFPLEGPAIDSLNCFSQSGSRKFVRTDRWKLEYDMMGNGELYDVEDDPGELRNLYDDPAAAEVKTRMLEELLKWTIRAEDDLPHGSYVQKKAPRNWYAAEKGSP